MVDRCLLSLLIWTSHFLGFIFISLIDFHFLYFIWFFSMFFSIFLEEGLTSSRVEPFRESPLGREPRGPCVAWGKSWAYRPAAKTNDPRRAIRMPGVKSWICWKGVEKSTCFFSIGDIWYLHSCDGFSIVMLIFGFVEGVFFNFLQVNQHQTTIVWENTFFFTFCKHRTCTSKKCFRVWRGESVEICWKLKLLGGFDEESFIYHIFYLIGQDEVSWFRYL